MALPPSNGNPYTTYLAELHDTLYQSPPSSFRPRIIVLCVICTYGILISLLYWQSLRDQYSDSKHPLTREVESVGGRQLQPFWFARRVDDYITLNLHAIIPLGGSIACICMLIYSYTEYVVLAENRLMGPINTFRSFMWLSVTLEGYIVTAASFQSYIVVARKSQRMSGGRWKLIPPPRVFNLCFLVLTFGMAGSLVGSTIALAIVWTRAWKAISGLRKALEMYEARWTGGVDVAALLDLNARKSEVTAKVAQTVPFQHAVVGSLIVCAMLIALLNIGSVALLLLLRRQIRASLARRSRLPVFALEPEPPAPLTFSRRDIPVIASVHAQSPQLGSTPPEKFTQQVDPAEEAEQPHLSVRLSLPFLPRLGRRKSSDCTLTETLPGSTPGSLSAGWGSWKEKLNPANLAERLVPASPAIPMDLGGRDTLLDLRRAERDLMVCVVLVVSMGLMFGAENIWNYVYVLPNDVSWPAVEFSYFFCPWAFTIIYSTGCSILVVSSHIATIRQRRRASAMAQTDGRRPSLAVQMGANVGLETFLGGGEHGRSPQGMGIEFGDSEEPRRPPVIRFPSADRVPHVGQ